jgi:hypothetical protein
VPAPVRRHARLTPQAFDGAQVKAGQQLTEGAKNPHRILRIQGSEICQLYLLAEVQDVYRNQGVNIACLTMWKARTTLLDAQPELETNSVRLELGQVDRFGKVRGSTGTSWTAPLDGPPTVECGAYVEVPGRRLGLDGLTVDKRERFDGLDEAEIAVGEPISTLLGPSRHHISSSCVSAKTNCWSSSARLCPVDDSPPHDGYPVGG